MNLPTAVTVTHPPVTRPSGEVRTFRPVTLSALNVTLIDSAKLKRCEARILSFPQPLVLWTGAAYDAAGDYTQAQAEARIRELLGPDIKAGLERLFVPPPRP